MAGVPAIEVVVRARDEATAVMRAIGKELDAAAKKAATPPPAPATLRPPAAAAAGGIEFGQKAQSATRAAIDFTAAIASGQDATSSMVGSLAGMAGMLGGPVAIGLTLGAAGVLKYIEHLDEAERKQLAWNKALQSFDPAFFIAEMEKATDALDLMGQRSETAFGRFQNFLNAVTAAEAPEAKRDQAAQEAATRLQLAGVQSLRQVQAQRAALAAESASARERAAVAAGDTAGAMRAALETESKLTEKLTTDLAALNAERRKAENAAPGQKLAPAAAQAFDERKELLQEQAAKGAADRQEARRQAAEAAEERAAQKQLQRQLQAIEGEKAIELAVAQSAARRATAEAQRLGTVEQVVAAEVAGILKVRDVKMAEIAAIANAEARAARGPGREEQVLAAREKEAREAVRASLRAVEEVSAATQRGLADRQQREEQFRAIQRSLGQITAEEELKRQQDIMAGAERMSQVWLDAYGKVAALQKEIRANAEAAAKPTPEGPKLPQREGEIPLDPLTRSILLQQGLAEARAGQTPYSIHAMLPEALKRPPLPPGALPGLAEGGALPSRTTAAGAIKMFRDAAGELTIADDFEAASTSADKLTTSVQGLVASLKQLDMAPELIAKVSQGLADALTFAGARHP